jgi:ABC-type nitrate/sulfonate/bicarbonate transport system substrate-binding protein
MKKRTLVRTRFGAVALGLAVLAATAACGSDDTSEASSGSDGGLTTVKVMMFPGQGYRLEPLVAEDQGFFKDRGIKMEIVDQPPTLQGVQGLMATKSDVSQLTVGTLGQGVQGGNDAKFFCGGINVLQTSLMVPTDSKLPSVEDGATWEEVLQSLEGKKVGVQTPVGSALQLIFAAALKEAGVTDVTYVNLGGAPTGTIAALENGSVDVAQTNPPTTQYFQETKAAKPILYMSDGPKVYADYYGSGWASPTAWLDENPDLASDFCAAMKESLAYIQDPANKDSLAALFAKDTGLKESTALLVLDEAYDDYATELDESTLQETMEAYHDLGIFKPTPEMSTDVLVDDKSK